MRTSRLLALAAAVAGLAAATVVSAAPGDPDPAFGVAGRVTHDRGTAYREGTSIALQADGKYLVTGPAWGWETFSSAMWRFNADHSLDTTYGALGQAQGFGIRTGVKVLGGKALVTENVYLWVEDPVSHAFYRDILVARYNPDGTIDSTFGTAGRTPTFNAGIGGEQRFNGFGIAPGNKLVAGGWTTVAGGKSLLVVRFNADGTLDGTFGVGGILKLGTPGEQEIRAIDVNGLGFILVAGVRGDTGFYTLINASGTVVKDVTVTGSASPGAECNAALMWSPDRWLVGCGVALSAGNRDAVLYGINAAGNIDTGFTTTTTDLGGGGDSWRGLGVSFVDGKIYATGQGAAGRLAVGAFNTNGTPDTAFGVSGVYVMPESEYSIGGGIAAPGAQVVATGSRGGADRDIPVVALSRATGARATVAYFKGTASTSFGVVRVSPDGQGILVGGTTGLGDDPHFLTLTMNGAGVPDPAFGTGGYSLVTIPRMAFLTGARDAAVQMDGKVILTGDFGGWDTGNFRLGAARLTTTPPGGGDPTFNPTGTPGYNFVSTGPNAGDAPFTRGVRVQSDGKILAGGSGVSAGIRQIAVARFDANGIVDASYGTAGVAMSAFPTATTGRGIDLDPSGRVVAVGDGEGAIRLTRFTAGGVVDTTFGVGGQVTLPMPAGYTLQLANRMQTTFASGIDKITVAASVFSATGFGSMAVRFNGNGTLDTSYGGGNGWGYVEAATGAGAKGNFFGARIMPSGKLVTVGVAESTAIASRGAAVRFTAEGAPDLSFGGAGVRYYPDPHGTFQPLDVAGSLDGSLYIAGTYESGALQLGAVTKTVTERLPAVQDFNADGRSDLLWRNTATGQVYRIFMNGFASSGGATAYTEPNTAWKVVIDADVNGDGVTDLVWRHDTTGQVYVMTFGSNGLPSGGAMVHAEPNPAWKIVHAPDLDGDGKADLLWWNSSTGQVYAMLLDGAAIKSQGFVYTEPNTVWKIVAAGDFAGSGKKNQLLWRNVGTGQVYLMTLGFSGGVYTQTGTMIYQEANIAWKIIAAADFDGDGKSDILWRNDTTGQVYLMLSNGTGGFKNQGMVYTEPNPDWKIVAQGDYDGDGKADLLWRNQSSGQVYMMRMNGLVVSSQAMVYQEPNTSWKVLGTYEYTQTTGVLGP